MLLEATSVSAGYGKRSVLLHVSMGAGVGDVVAVVGPNGSGKSTLLKVLHGELPLRDGQVQMDGRPLAGLGPAGVGALGVSYVPQGRRVFPGLTVAENLAIGGLMLGKTEARSGVDRALGWFPLLKSRLSQRAETLSGGEQQALALARSLVADPRVLLLDEPSLGLSPGNRARAFAEIGRLAQEGGMAVVIVEQNVREVLKVSRWAYVLKLGRVEWSGPAAELGGNRDRLQALFL